MKIKARYSGKCARCGDPIKAGDEVEYDPECKSVMHPQCAIDAEDTEASPIKPVQAGTTARYRSPKQEADYQSAKAEREHVEFLRTDALVRIANHKCDCTYDGCVCLDFIQDIAREAIKAIGSRL